MPKCWVQNYFAHGSFPEVGQKQKTEKKKERDRAKVGDNNGQATHGARNPPGPITCMIFLTVLQISSEYWYDGSCFCGGGGVVYGPFTLSLQLELCWIELGCDKNKTVRISCYTAPGNRVTYFLLKHKLMNQWTIEPIWTGW